jgi:tripartite-type tricarboxylate transporter receptor subunit TctC
MNRTARCYDLRTQPRTLAVVIGLALAALCAFASAQPYPSKPIRIIVAFPPGGATDIVARMVGQKMGENIGQQVIVDNRGGANGIVGTELAARAAPDGYTLFVGTLGNLSANPTLYAKKLPFDMTRDFAPITQLVNVWFMLIVHPSFPARSVKELIVIAKTRPGQINYASSGAGGGPHLAAELFNMMAGTRMTHIPYKGSGPSYTDLLAGQVQLTFDSVVQGLQYVKAGRLRALAVLGSQRSPLLPDVPTAAETLLGYEVTNWFGMVVPAATPVDVRTRIHSEVAKVLRTPDMKERLLGQGAEPVGSTPEEFSQFMRAETVKWAKVIREANIQAE